MQRSVGLVRLSRGGGVQGVVVGVDRSSPATIALPVEVQESFEKLTRGRLVEGYGLTEATTGTHANPLGGLRKVGRPERTPQSRGATT